MQAIRWAKHRYIIFESNTDMQVISEQTTHMPLSVMNNKAQRQWAYEYQNWSLGISICLVGQTQVCIASCY